VVARVIGVSLAVAIALAPGDARADLGPRQTDSRLARARSWRAEGGWLVSAPQRGTGTRVAALVEVAGAAPVRLEARGVDGARRGRWLAMAETFREGATRVAVVDLGQSWPAAELRLPAADQDRVGDLGWEILIPRFPDAGRRARAAGPERVALALDTTLQTIGVVSRSEWGARATQCTTPEDDWYRMAIHHTAGPQTSGGSVAAVLRSLQAYEQDAGEYCDLPYQFMVGYDGSLYEGRPLTLYSGATGGGNNDGNLAVCFVGCYHPSGCPGGVSHQATDEMLAGAHLLVQTLTRVHDIPTTSSSIRGHRDWPGNSTACPGDYVYSHLGELRADLAWYAAAETDRSAPADAPLSIGVGAPAEVWIELENRGGLTWEPGEVFLATTDPREGSSPLADESWPAPGRAATVSAPVAPGEVGRFAFRVRAAEAGDFQQSFGLVAADGTWFADGPWGGGPADDAIALEVHASADGGSGGSGDAGIDGDGDGDDGDGNLAGGCRAGGRAAPAAAWLLLVALLQLQLGRRRRRNTARRAVV
jgi:hypothetical protein